MQQSEMVAELKSYIAEQILDGEDIGLNETTPLLEWGIINSMEIFRLVNFIHEKYDVEIALEKMVAQNFVNLDAIVNLIQEYLHIGLAEQ